ncbi:MAG: ankyrin repeat domain-containing protein [Bacteroidetes bacterium]|nr:ankyrin repeat domain-containing protein [Bacteroidota bacterium]
MKKTIIFFCLTAIVSIKANAQQIFDAIRNNDITKVHELIEKDPNLVNTPGDNHFTPLLFATNSNKPEIAEFLISKGANIEEVFLADYYGSTPISFAIRNNNLDLVKLLLAKGANIQYRTKLGENYLHFAAAQNRVEIAEYLINNGIDINSVKNGGLTPLHIAVITGSVDVVKLLIDKGAKLNIRCNDNGTPIHFAFATRNREIEDILRKNGASDFPRNFPEYKGKYLGQQAPGEEPVMFAPELFRDIYRSYGAPQFSPDGKELFFYGYFMPGVGFSSIWYMKEDNGIWTVPVLAPFSDFNSWGPSFSPDGKKLYFASTRLRGEKATSDGDLWYSEKQPDGTWSLAKHLGSPPNRDKYHDHSPKIANDGTLYFTSGGSGGRGTYIYKSKLINGKYTNPEALDDYIESDKKDDCLDMENIIYFLFGPDGGKISICFHKPDGTWSKPVYMGDKIHQGQGSSDATISPDGKYFFFVQNISPYWVSASLIEDLRKEALKDDK